MGQANSSDHYFGRSGSKDRQSYPEDLYELYRNMYYYQQMFMLHQNYPTYQPFQPFQLWIQQQQQQQQQQALYNAAAVAAATTVALAANNSTGLFYPQTAAAINATPIPIPTSNALSTTTPPAAACTAVPTMMYPSQPNGVFYPRFLRKTYI